MDLDDELTALLAKHSVATLDAHLIGRLPADQITALHLELMTLVRARREAAPTDPDAVAALARAVDAASTSLDVLETHPQIVNAAADRLLDAAEPDPPIAASNAPQRVTQVRTRLPDMRPRQRGQVSNIRASGGARLTETDLVEHVGDAARDVTRRGAIGTRRVATVEANPRVTRLGGDPADNERLIVAACDDRGRTLRASGGICSPSSALYDASVLASTARPVRDALVPFVADRGGIRYLAPPRLSGVTSGVAVWTAANDANPTSPTTKPTVTMACGEVQEVLVNAVTASIKVGNFRQLYAREQVDAWLRALDAEHARVAELTLLDTMMTGSVNVVTNAVLGASRDVLATVDRAASAYRSRQRLASDEILTFIAPAWLRDLVRVDLVREAYTELSELGLAYPQIDALFTSRNLSPVWSLDWEPAAAQVDALLDGWASTCPLLMFHPSSWLFLDGGTINLGVVRDATLVGTNDFLMFSESMENAALRGIESLLVTMSLCPDGSTSAAIDISGTVCPQGS